MSTPETPIEKLWNVRVRAAVSFRRDVHAATRKEAMDKAEMQIFEELADGALTYEEGADEGTDTLSCIELL